MATRRRSTQGSWLRFFAFLAVMLLGLGLAVGIIFSNINVSWGVSAGNWIQRIAIAISLPIPMILSFQEAWNKRTVWRVLWVIAVILIVVFYIWGFWYM